MPSKFLAVVLAFFGVVVFQFFSGEKSALLVIDVQNCFLSGGTLEVPGGDEIVPLIKDIKEKYDWDVCKIFSLFLSPSFYLNCVPFSFPFSKTYP